MSRLTVGVLTDLHLVQDAARKDAWVNPYDFDGVGERVARALEVFRRAGTELVAVLGDVAHDGDGASLARALRLLRVYQPVMLVGGNHDGARPVETLARAGAPGAWLASWQARSVGAAVRTAGIRIECEAVDRCRAARPAALRTWGDGLVLLASHFPLISREEALSAAGLPYAEDLRGRAGLTEAVTARTGPTLAICGHLHVRDSAIAGSLLQLSCGALIEPPFEATVLTIDTDGARTQVERVAHELGRGDESRDPRLVRARQRFTFEPERGWHAAEDA